MPGEEINLYFLLDILHNNINKIDCEINSVSMIHQYLLNEMLYSDLVKLKLYSDARHKQKESNNFLLIVFMFFIVNL